MTPTQIEQAYVDQGYVLPHGLTWAMVAEGRAKYGVSAICVPLACAPGCCAWGVPMVDGRFLSYGEG